MAATSEIKAGMYITLDGELYLIIEREFYKPGKGGAFNRVKLRNLKNGKVTSQTWKSDQKVEEVEVQSRSAQYLYVDGSDVHFMDSETFEQITLPLATVPGGTDYLHTDAKYIASYYQDKVISIQVPVKMTLTVTETSGAVRGNTAGNATKEAILETGAKVQVPLFISTGDKIIINTELNSYATKA